jgi:hypothetical protein
MLGDKIRQISAKCGKKKIFLAFCLLFFGAICVYLGNRDKGPQGGMPQEAVLSGEDIPSQPDRSAEIYGMITSVRGNKITVLKFDPSMMPGAKKSASSDSEQKAREENALSLGITDALPGGGMPAGERPNGGMSGGGNASGGNFSRGTPGNSGGGGDMTFGGDSSSRAEKLEELKARSIGTETIIVPVGIPILVQETDEESGQTAWEMGGLKDLTSDTVVILWTEESAGEGKAKKNAGEGIEVANSEESALEAELPEKEEALRVAEYVKVSGKADMDNSAN